jgi:hypothetical protein
MHLLQFHPRSSHIKEKTTRQLLPINITSLHNGQSTRRSHLPEKIWNINGLIPFQINISQPLGLYKTIPALNRLRQ